MAQLIPNNIQYFESELHFREWLDKNWNTCTEVWVGFYKKGIDKPTLTWSQSVDQALCYGWIDGIRKSVDAESYVIRFTPRNPKSVWSDINIKKVAELTAKGLMKPAGLKLFEVRTDNNSRLYSFEQKTIEFSGELLEKFKQNAKAWKFFKSMPPSYQKAATWWVISAKQEKTQQKRLETLINDSEAGLKIAALRR